MKGRHEHKFHINLADYLQLRSKLSVVAKLDTNVGEDGTYLIRSLYFDNYADKVVDEKLQGISRREKWRIRFYNDNLNFIRLEKKYKINNLTYKVQAKLTRLQVEQILIGNYEVLKTDEDPLLLELYTKMYFEVLRPRTIVDYTREVYVYSAGNVRVTFDTNLRTSNNIHQFLEPSRTTTPASHTILLEVKYDGFLTDILQKIVNIDQRSQTEFSKYIASRFVK